MTALLVILVMLFLAIVLTVSYFPRRERPAFTKLLKGNAFQMEAAEELVPVDEKREPYNFEFADLETPPLKFEIPDSYDEDRITLLVRDPEWLFAYWEISASTQRNIQALLGDGFYQSTPTIRVFNVTESPTSNAYFDITLSAEVKRCHIHTNKPNCDYYVVIGRKKSNGEFVPILYSNIVSTPRKEVSPVLDMDWLPPLEFAHLLYNQSYASLSSWNVSSERKG